MKRRGVIYLDGVCVTVALRNLKADAAFRAVFRMPPQMVLVRIGKRWVEAGGVN